MERINDCDSFLNSITSAFAALASAEIPKLNEVWNDLWDQEQRHQRFEVLKSNILSQLSNAFNEALCRETQTKEECIEKVEQLLDEILKLENALGVKIPYDDVQSLPLHSMAIKLNEKCEKQRQIFEERRRLLKELTDKEAELAETLGALPVACDLPSNPSEADLERLAQHVSTLEAEKMARMAVFVRKRQQIVELYRKLGTTPSLNSERSIVSEDILKTFQVTSQNMERVDLILEQLKEDMKSAEEKRDYYVSTLRNMWSYLEEPEERQEKFLSAHSGYTSQDFAAIQDELERCRKEKSANIEKFVIRIREALVVEWDRCMVSQSTRDRFHVFRVDYYNEDVYDLHELELVRWQNFYRNNLDIFDLYRKHTELFEKLLELNGRSKSADRYQNRGGQLLLEEKQRKLVAKELPRIEKDLQTALEKFEETNGEPFTVFGKPMTDVIAENWSSNFDQKTIDKFRNPSTAGRTPLAAKRPAQPSTLSAKMRRMAPLSEKKTVRRGNEENFQEPDSTMNIEHSYENFQKTFQSKLGSNKLVGRSTEFLTPGREATTKKTRHLAVTPRTVPRRAAREVVTQSRTPLPLTKTPVTRKNLPIIL